jgi:hypothetical protein
MTTSPNDLTVHRAPLRVVVWLLHLSLPLLGLWLLLAQPSLDVMWEDHLLHFLLVVAAAGASLAVALRVRAEARRRRDARLVLVSLAFLAPSAFLLLHGFATPQVLRRGEIGRGPCGAVVRPLGPLALKGKTDPVTAFTLLDLDRVGVVTGDRR